MEKFFRGIAELTLFYGVAAAIVVITVPRIRGLHFSIAEYCICGLLILAVLVVGVSLFRRRRWAAVVASLGFMYYAWFVPQVLGSSWSVYLLALLFLVPACMTVLCWRSSIWKAGKEDC